MVEKPTQIATSVRWRLIQWSSLAISFAWLSIASLTAADIVVNRVNDSGAGSLRQGLSGAGAGDRLVFDPILNGTTLVNSQPLVLNNAVSLVDANTISLVDNHAFTLASPLTVDWAGTLRLNGILSDGTSPGSVATTGLGTLILAGSNTFSGGTSLNGGTLEVLNSGALGTGALSVNNTTGNPTLILGNGINLNNNISLQSTLILNTGTGTSQLGGVISGSGSPIGITTTGTGTLILSGANTFSGGLYVTNNSTIVAQNSQALGAGTVTVAGGLNLTLASGINVNNVFSLSNNLTANVNSGTATQSGSIGETSSSQFIKTGAGTLIMAGTNSYTGGTFVNQGTLQGDSNSLVGNINNSASLVFNQAATGTFAGDITGSGNLTKSGIGTLILSGNNSFVGNTTVNTGELQVLGSLGGNINVASPNAALTGTGTVGNVTNNGFVQPGTGATNNGTITVFNVGNLTVNGNFTQQAGGTTEIKVTSTGNTPGVSNDILTVNGQAKLDGNLKIFAVGGGVFSAGTQYTILNAAGGVTGQYAQASSNLATYGVGVTYGSNDVTFQLIQTSSLHGNAATPNQFAVGSALDNITLSSTGGLFSMINSLGIQSPGQQQQSLNQLSGEMFGNLQTIGLQVGDQFQQRVASRLTNNGQFLIGQSNNDSSDPDVRGQLQVYGSSKGWMQGYGVGGNIRSDGNGAGVNYSQGGAVYGMDWGDEESGCVGVTGGNSYVGFSDGFNASGQLTSYQVGAYALKHNESAYVLSTANYGNNAYTTNRNVTVGGSNQSLHANFGGNQVGTNIEAGLKFESSWLHIQPLVGLQYLYLAQQGFNESGGPAALSVLGTNASSLRSNIGVRLATDPLVGVKGAVWTPYTQARLVSELLDNNRIVNASFNGAPIGGAFTSQGSRIGNVYEIIGEGIQVRLNEQWALYGGIDVMIGERITTETGSATVVYYW